MNDPKLKHDGCGPWWLPAWTKDDFFREECNTHDADYIARRDRKMADIEFLWNMLRKAKDSKIRAFQAYLYYYLVRAFGWTYYWQMKFRRD